MKTCRIVKICWKNAHPLFILAGFASFFSCSNPTENNEAVLTDFTLEDVNPASATYGELIGPSFYAGEVSAYYFGDAG